MKHRCGPYSRSMSTIGDRLREVRKRRGLSQRELAASSGVSLSLVRKLEQGTVDNTRLETVHKLARVLRVPTSKLMDRSAVEPSDAAAGDGWAAVRQALVGRPDDLDEPPTVDGVAQVLDSALPLFRAERFAELGTVLPRLLRDTETLADLEESGRTLRVQLLQLTGWLLTQTRHLDAAEMALDMALDASADRLQGGATANAQCWVLLLRGQLAEARELAIRWADDVEPKMSRATADELCVWGMLLLRVSAAAVRDNRVGEAKDSLRLAHGAAVVLGRELRPREDLLRTFGPTTVALKRTENAMISDRPDMVLKLADKIPMVGIPPTPSNHNRHRLDVAKAYAQTRQYAEAVRELTSIWHTSPEWLPHQRYAREILSIVIEHRRTLTPEMRVLADVLRLPL